MANQDQANRLTSPQPLLVEKGWKPFSSPLLSRPSLLPLSMFGGCACFLGATIIIRLCQPRFLEPSPGPGVYHLAYSSTLVESPRVRFKGWVHSSRGRGYVDQVLKWEGNPSRRQYRCHTWEWDTRHSFALARSSACSLALRCPFLLFQRPGIKPSGLHLRFG